MDVTRGGKRIATREAGDFVGEIALLTSARRTATVTATDAASLPDPDAGRLPARARREPEHRAEGDGGARRAPRVDDRPQTRRSDGSEPRALRRRGRDLAGVDRERSRERSGSSPSVEAGPSPSGVLGLEVLIPTSCRRDGRRAASPRAPGNARPASSWLEHPLDDSSMRACGLERATVRRDRLLSSTTYTVRAGVRRFDPNFGARLGHAGRGSAHPAGSPVEDIHGPYGDAHRPLAIGLHRDALTAGRTQRQHVPHRHGGGT